MELFEKYYLKAVKFLSYRPRSEKEVRDNLKKKNAPEETIEQIILMLKNQRFLSDEAFAVWWFEQRATYRQRAKRVIAMELAQKGVRREVIEKVLAEKKDEVSDLDQAKKLVEKKLRVYKNLPKDQLYNKLGGFLVRRGFSWDVVRTSIDEVLQMQYNEANRQ